MNNTTPSLRRHTTGQWFVKYGGKCHYLGSVEADATRLYAEELKRWAAWKAGSSRPTLASFPRAGVAVMEAPRRVVRPSPVSGPTVQDAADKLLRKIEDEASLITHRAARLRIAYFTKKLGSKPLTNLSPDDLLSWRSGMIRKGLAPNTINPTIVLVRRVLTLAYETEMVERPFRLSLLKGVESGEIPNKSLRAESISALLELMAEHRPNLARMLLLQYWCCLRPSEVSRLVYGEGTWVDADGREASKPTGYFKLTVGKTTKKTGLARVVVLTPAALELLGRTEKECPNFEALGQATVKVSASIGAAKVKSLCGKSAFRPHPLRHSAQTHLVQAEVADNLINCASGHVLGKVQRVYRPQPLSATRKALEALTTLVPLPKSL